MVRKSKKIKAILALVAANIIWGITPAFNKIGLREFTPLWFFVLRYSLAAVASFFIFKQRGRKIKPKDHFKVAMSAWVGISFTIVLMYYGLRITRATDASIISSLGPIMLFWLSIIFLKERFRWQPLIGTSIALVGSLIVILGPMAKSSHGHNLNYVIGGILVFASIFMDQLGAIMTQPLLRKYDLSRLALWRVVYAVIPVFLLALILEPVPAFKMQLSTAISLFYLVIFGITIAFWLYYYGARKLAVEDFSVLFYVDPILGVLSSMVILGERPSLKFFIGASCIVAGIVITELHLNANLKKRFMHLLRHK